MCIGIIRNNSLVGGRARAELNPGHWARCSLLHMAAECVNHSAMKAGQKNSWLYFLSCFYDRPFLHVCNLEENLLFSTLILGSVFNDYVVFYGNLTGVQVKSMNGKVVDENSESVHVMDMDSTLGHYMSCFSISLALDRMFNVVVFFLIIRVIKINDM